MSWNHRVMCRVDAQGNRTYAIHEVYYDIDGVKLWTDEDVAPMGESLAGLREEIQSMLSACDKQVLNHETGRRAPK